MNKDIQWMMDAVMKFSFFNLRICLKPHFVLSLTHTKPPEVVKKNKKNSSTVLKHILTWILDFFFFWLTLSAFQAWIDAFGGNKEIRSRRFSEHLQFSPDMKHIQGFVAAIQWGRILTNHVEAPWPCHVMWHSPPAPRSPPGILSVVFCSSGAPHSDPQHSRTPALWQVPFHGTRPTTLWGGGRGHWPGSVASRPPVLSPRRQPFWIGVGGGAAAEVSIISSPMVISFFIVVGALRSELPGDGPGRCSSF